jgi:hypothetical protein
MAAQVRDLVQRELDAVARVLDALAPDNPAEGERAARTLASVARTLRELSMVSEEGDEAEAAADDDDDIPRDIDELRRELARRIHAFVDERTGSRLPVDAEAGHDRLAGG